MEQQDAGSRSTALFVLGLFAAASLAICTRLLHLANTGHYYILSQDSHFFHWQAARALAGDSVPLGWHGGLTYPLAYGARLVSFATGMSEAGALTAAGKLLPPAIGVVGLLVTYWGVDRLYGRRAALGAAFLWAVLGHVYWTQASGYLDRDGLSVVLLAAAVFVFHLSRQLHFKVKGRDGGWAVACLPVMGLMALLVAEWLWLGAVLLAAVLVATVLLEVVAGTAVRAAWDFRHQVNEIAMLSRLPRHALAALARSSWRQVALILGLSLAVAMFKPGASYIGQMAADVFTGAASGTQQVGELRPLQVRDLFVYVPMAIPLIVGLYVAVRRHREADILCLAWLLSLASLAVFASRLILYAAPATCVIGGLGLANIFDFSRSGRSPRYWRTPLGAMVVPSGRFLRACLCSALGLLMVIAPLAGAYHLGDGDRLAADQGWQDALGFLNRETPADAVVMSWWDYGYWILDMGGRRPVVDNGYYGWDEERLNDVGLVYCTGDTSVAERLMRAHQADYLVFSRWEVAILPTISRYGVGEGLGDGLTVPDELKDSLYYRTVFAGSQVEGSLRRVYPAPGVEEPEVVVLKRGVAASPAGT